MEQLTQALDLTAEQQTRIFPILVRGARSYDPDMQVVDGRGSNGNATPLSENTAATEPLDPQHEQELLQENPPPASQPLRRNRRPFPMHQTMRETYLESTCGERGCDHHSILVTDEDGGSRVRKVTVYAPSCAADLVKEIPEAEYAAHSINGKSLADLVRRALRTSL